MKCDKIIQLPNQPTVHGLRVQKYPRTGYVFCNGEDRVPLPNDGKILDDPKQYRSIFTAVDGDTMKVAWQVIVDGNLDNVDADYQGKYAFSTCYNSEEGVTLAEMMAKEQDWVVIFNLKRIEEAVRDGKARDDRRRAGARRPPGVALHPLRPGRRNSPHGINTAPDGIHVVANGKLSPTVTVFDVRKFDDLFDDKIQPRDTVVAEPELGLGPLHTAYDGKGNAYTTLFLDSQVVQVEHRSRQAGLQGREGQPDHPEARRPLPARPQPHLHGPDQGGRRQMADLAEQVLEGPLPQRRPAQARERPAHRHLGRPDGARARRPELRRAARRDHRAPLQDQPGAHLEARRPVLRRRGQAGRRPTASTWMADSKVVRDGNKVRVYMTSAAPAFGLESFQVKQGDEVTVYVTNIDDVEDLTHGFCIVNYGINMEIGPQATASVTFMADQAGRLLVLLHLVLPRHAHGDAGPDAGRADRTSDDASALRHRASGAGGLHRRLPRPAGLGGTHRCASGDADLQAVLDGAADGDVVVLRRGDHRGPRQHRRAG